MGSIPMASRSLSLAAFRASRVVRPFSPSPERAAVFAATEGENCSRAGYPSTNTGELHAHGPSAGAIFDVYSGKPPGIVIFA